MEVGAIEDNLKMQMSLAALACAVAEEESDAIEYEAAAKELAELAAGIQ